MRMTIAAANPNPREWTGEKGTVHFLSGTFSDGSDWSLGCKPENFAERLATFQALVGVEAEYELEARPEYEGRRQWRIKSWPGKPVYTGGGGASFPPDAIAALERIAGALETIAGSAAWGISLPRAAEAPAALVGPVPAAGATTSEEPLQIAGGEADVSGSSDSIVWRQRAHEFFGTDAKALLAVKRYFGEPYKVDDITDSMWIEAIEANGG